MFSLSSFALYSAKQERRISYSLSGLEQGHWSDTALDKLIEPLCVSEPSLSTIVRIQLEMSGKQLETGQAQSKVSINISH